MNSKPCFHKFSQFFSELIPSDSSPVCCFCWLITQLYAVTDACKDKVTASPGARLSPKLSCSLLLWKAEPLGELGYYFFFGCKQDLGLKNRKLLLGTGKKLMLLASVSAFRHLAWNGSDRGEGNPVLQDCWANSCGFLPSILPMWL